MTPEPWRDKDAPLCRECGHVVTAHVHMTFDTVGCQLICCPCKRFVA